MRYNDIQDTRINLTSRKIRNETMSIDYEKCMEKLFEMKNGWRRVNAFGATFFYLNDF
ncbi:hypothetical protein [Butyrivibrio sp. AC2005]|uniref:hypothetical protein n=1 Tax=Butyrivibrio sp. AC2005 TaxID=1280672 RepID=UPI000415A897|nr:hypothetical protein [Butyrivibrio sp. AC2005]